MAEPVLEHIFLQHGGPPGHGAQGEHLALHVGGEARVGQGHQAPQLPGPLRALDVQVRALAMDAASRLPQDRQQGGKMLPPRAPED